MPLPHDFGSPKTPPVSDRAALSTVDREKPAKTGLNDANARNDKGTSPPDVAPGQLDLFRFLLDRLADPAYLIDEHACVLHANDKGHRILGYDYGELADKSFLDIDPSYSLHRWLELLRQQPQTHHTRHRRKDRRLIPVEVSCTGLELTGSPYRIVLVRPTTDQDRAALGCESEFRALVENSPDTIARYDCQLRRRYGNRSLARLLDLPAAKLLGKRPTDNVLNSTSQAYEHALRTVVASGEEREYEHNWPSADGRMISWHLILKPEFSTDGRITGVVAVGRDITALKESERRLRQAEAMARLGHWQWDCPSKEIRISSEMSRILGQASDWQARPRQILRLVIGEDRKALLQAMRNACRQQHGEFTLDSYRIRVGNRILHLHTHIQAEYNATGQTRRLSGTTRDVSDLKNYESRLQKMAYHDSLTGLPNRTLLGERLAHNLEKATRNKTILGLLILDIDRFKEVNDSHGHDFGDRLLRECGERLQRLVRDYDIVARLGGDEFALVLPNIRAADDLGSISRKILDTLAQPFQLGQLEAFVSASIGIAVFPSDSTCANELFQYADSALYDAKGRGRAGFRFYSAELTAQAKQRGMLETALRRAESAGELVVFYQPKIDLASTRLVGAEALLRWQHPSLGLVQPDKFIGIAEDTGLIVGIGAWVLKQACRTARRWNENSSQALKIAVNLSSRQFRDNDLVALVSDCLQATGCSPAWLEFEITESLLLEDNEAIGIALKAFRAMGISIAIDDFGTGYSSLAYLKRFPINVLKIDRSFINDVMLDRDSTELVKGIITMAHSLRLELVAEGIENAVQEQFLQDFGCHFGQGYRYGKPMPQASFEAHPLMLACRQKKAGRAPQSQQP